jgi:cyclophilin family peptidyl-prolyl cis-trans isomerase
MNKATALLSIILMTLATSCAQKKDFVVTIKTNYGDMVAILYDETPKHKENFIKLVEEHYYDSLLFHRVMEGFMIQGGDPESKNARPGQQLGTGGPGYQIDAEINPKFFHKKGALAAARTPNPAKASSGSQFYIVQGTVIPESSLDELKIDQGKMNQAMQQFVQNPDNKILVDSLSKVYYSGDMQAYKECLFGMTPQIESSTGIKITKEVSQEKIDAYTTVGGYPPLDGEYTVFGQVIQGLDVIDKIATLPKDQANRPNDDLRMFVTGEEVSRKKITKEYGYEYPNDKDESVLPRPKEMK